MGVFVLERGFGAEGVVLVYVAKTLSCYERGREGEAVIAEEGVFQHVLEGWDGGEGMRSDARFAG